MFFCKWPPMSLCCSQQSVYCGWGPSYSWRELRMSICGMGGRQNFWKIELETFSTDLKTIILQHENFIAYTYDSNCLKTFLTSLNEPFNWFTASTLPSSSVTNKTNMFLSWSARSAIKPFVNKRTGQMSSSARVTCSRQQLYWRIFLFITKLSNRTNYTDERLGSRRGAALSMFQCIWA